MERSVDWQVPRRRDALGFWLRTRLLSARRLLRDALRGDLRRWPVGTSWADTPVLAQVRSPLWTDGRPEEFVLVAGKVHNLRIAARAFHAVEVPAGAVLSFWSQLGRPTAARGFVEGREVREGCVVPTLGGGICQISNALADAAWRAGFELLERHGHSARIEQASPADADRLDATVFWRHIDLRLRASHDWRIELTLSADQLILTLRGAKPQGRPAVAIRAQHEAPPSPSTTVARGCLSCEEVSCFRHRGPAQPAPSQGRTACLLDAWTPEFASCLEAEGGDWWAPLPMRLAFWRPTARAWTANDKARLHHARWASAARHLWQRLWSRAEGGRRQAALLAGQGLLARAYARRLDPLHTRLVVDQTLLPHLELLGVLAGRELVVLAPALPMDVIEARLDRAARQWPEDGSLRDFRAPRALVEAEAKALARASQIVTAHAEVAAVLRARFKASVELLPWQMAPSQALASARPEGPPLLVFPSSGLARKGARELAAALRTAPICRLRILGRPVHLDLWQGLDVEFFQADRGANPLSGAHGLVLPAHVEHSPRLLLSGLSLGLPVIASAACGLGNPADQANLTVVPAGDIEALREALCRLLLRT